MQISRHWRLNAQRYRLQGVRYGNGEVRLQAKYLGLKNPSSEQEKKPIERVPAIAA